VESGLVRGPISILRALALGIGALLAAVMLLAPGAAAAAPLSIRIEGNHFVNGEGQTIRLLGVDRTSSEYACVDGFGYDDGHYDDADAAAIASWKANAVRVPLNEDCWLGINKQPNSSGGAETTLTVAGYRQEIENYVADLNAHGIYAILDLHWTAPGEQVAMEQQPMPDSHSVTFWESVAETFKSNPAVVFDLFNEPFSPNDPRSGDDPDPLHAVTWGCWKNGGCTTDIYNAEEEPSGFVYNVVGMQELLNAVRDTGATQPLLLGGLNFADDLTGWMENKPTDPLNQEAASFHNYQGEGKCDDVACWNNEIAPVAAAVPVVTGEFAEDVCTPRNFDNEYMDWADAHGVSYLAWAWVVLSQEDKEKEGCEAFTLINDYSGTPASPNGVAVHDHLLALAGGTAGGTGTTGAGKTTPAPAKIKLLRFHPTVEPGGAKVSFQLEAAQSCKAAIAGLTAKPFKLGGRKARKVGLGSATQSLTANKPAKVTIKLPAKARLLLKAKGSLKAHFTVTLSGGGNATTVTPQTALLKEPKPKKH
jgi:endoglucanase